MQLGQQLLDALDDADGVGARLALHIEDDGRRLVHPRGLIVVLDSVDNLRDIGQHDGSAVAIGNHDVAVVVAAYQLIIRIDLVVLPRPVEVAFRGIDARLGDRGAEIFQIDAVGRERSRVCLDTHRRLLSAADADQAHAAELRDLRRQPRVDQVFDLGKRNGSST